MRAAVLILTLLAGLWLAAAQAQTPTQTPDLAQAEDQTGLPDNDPLPRFAHTSVNDFAGVLTPADTQRLDEALIALNRATGVEGTVVTLHDRRRYGAESVERFTRRLFDAWGVGDARRNTGFMVLMLPSDREVRIELGRGYGQAWNAAARRIVDRDMLPAFRQGRMSAGLTQGSLAVIEEIARPATAGQTAPALSRPRQSVPGVLLPVAAFGVIGMTLFNLVRGIIRKRRDRQCPQCAAALSVGDDVIRDTLPGGTAVAGQRIVTRTCPACGWSSQQVLGAPVVNGGWVRGGYLDGLGRGRGFSGSRSGRGSRGGGGFGGGRSGGGGATGRW